VRSIRQPAYVLDRYWNVLASNAPARKLFTGWLTAGSEYDNR